MNGTLLIEDRLPDGAGGTAEAPLAVAHAEDRDRRGAGAIVVGENQTARGRQHREPAKEVAGHVLALGELRLAR